MSESLCLLELRHIVVRETDCCDFSRLADLEQGGPVFLDARIRRRPVHLTQVDALDAQPSKALIDDLANGVGLSGPNIGRHRIDTVGLDPAFREHVGPVPEGECGRGRAR